MNKAESLFSGQINMHRMLRVGEKNASAEGQGSNLITNATHGLPVMVHLANWGRAGG